MNAPRVLFVKAMPAAAPIDLDTSLVRSDEPTPAQAEAGNYAKRVLPWRGLTIRIENEAGTVRRGTDPTGRAWESTMALPYGYFVESMGVDGDPVDVYVGPLAETADQVFIVHQKRVGDWKKFDEDKVFVGMLTEDEARAAFLLCYDDPRFLGPITAMPVDEFVAKVRATRENPAMIKSAATAPILFIKARDRRDTETVTEPRADLIAEHERLVSVLESPSHEDDEEEAKRQAAELDEYKSGEHKDDRLITKSLSAPAVSTIRRLP